MKVVMQVRSLKRFLQLGFVNGRAEQPCRKSGICSFSSAAEAEAEAQDIATASADSGVLIPGRADVAGTSNYMQRFASQAGPGHFRRFRVGGDVGDLVVSSMGMGTWQGDEKDEVDAKYVAAITRGLGVGFNIIDTSPCYRDCRSETAVGKSLAMAIQQGVINRNEVIVCSKVGFVHEDFRNRCGYDVHVRSLITSGVLQEKDVLDHDYHCMTPPYIKHMVDVSRKDLGVETIDVYYLHNPDVYLTDIPLETLLQMIKCAFATFEELVSEGKITMYGIATWSAFRVSPKAMSYLPLENIVSLAREVGGENHHFKVIESAYNANFQELATFPVQTVRGKKMPVLHAAHRLGLSVVGACSLSMNFLARNLKPEIRNKSPELGLERTNAQCALQFARTTPGIMTSLVGMSSMAHVEENAAIIKFPANPRS